MARTLKKTSRRLAQLIRSVVALLIAAVLRNRDAREIDVALRRRPLSQQALICLAVLALLFGLSLFAAQFGWVGLLVFWLLVILLVN